MSDLLPGVDPTKKTAASSSSSSSSPESSAVDPPLPRLPPPPPPSSTSASSSSASSSSSSPSPRRASPSPPSSTSATSATSATVVPVAGVAPVAAVAPVVIANRTAPEESTDDDDRDGSNHHPAAIIEITDGPEDTHEGKREREEEKEEEEATTTTATTTTTMTTTRNDPLLSPSHSAASLGPPQSPPPSIRDVANGYIGEDQSSGTSSSSRKWEVFSEDSSSRDLDDFYSPTERRSPAPRGATTATTTNGVLTSGTQPNALELDEITINYGQVKYRVRPKRLPVEDFSTIDWMRSRDQNLSRISRLRQLKGASGWWRRRWDQSQTWIVLTILGLVVGTIASVVNIVSDWLANIKEGYCSNAWWLSQDLCCWEYGYSTPCPQWVYWNEVVANPSSGGASFFAFIVYTLIALSFTILSGMCVKYISPYLAGSGMPEIRTIVGGFVIHQFLGLKVIFIKFFILIPTVAANLNIGKEGPVIHVSAGLGNVISQMFRKYRLNEAKRREMIAAGMSAGLAASFGAPLGGVLFCIEYINYYYNSRVLMRAYYGCLVMIGIMVLIDPYGSGSPVSFNVVRVDLLNWHFTELFLFALIGVFGGIAGAVFVRVNIWLGKMRKYSWLKDWTFTEVMWITIISAILQYPLIYTRIQTERLILIIFNECSSKINNPAMADLCDPDKYWTVFYQLILASLIKLLLFSFTNGIKAPGGLFIPCMAIGGCFGRAVGMLMETVETYNPGYFVGCNESPCVYKSLYAVVGAAAMLGGVNRVTVSLAVILLEVTGSTTYMIPVMMVLVISKWIGDALQPLGIYSSMLLLAGLPYLDPQFEYLEKDLVADLMVTKNIRCISSHMELGEVDDLLKSCKFSGFPIVNNEESMQLLGYVSRSQLQVAVSNLLNKHGVPRSCICCFGPIDLEDMDVIDMRAITDKHPTLVVPTTTMQSVVQIFVQLGITYMIIIDGGQLVGIISKKDVIRRVLLLSRGDLHGIKF